MHDLDANEKLRRRIDHFVKSGVKARSIADVAGYRDLDLPIDVLHGHKTAGPRRAKRLHDAMDVIVRRLANYR